MKSLPPDVADRILRSNSEVHRVEAEFYDWIHPEVFGSYEQRQTNHDLDIIVSHLPKGRSIRVMDVGCGTGNITLKYLERGFDVRAVDLSPEMLGQLRAKIPAAKLSKVNLAEGNAEAAVSDPSTKGFYDIVSFSSVLHHLPDYMTVLSRALQQLRPGGFLWVCHEPLAIATENAEAHAVFAGYIIKQADNLYILFRRALVYAWFAAKHCRKPTRIDYSWSDYHARTGIAASTILKALESAGARVLLYESYNSRFSSILAACDHMLSVLPHQNFRFIVQAAKVDALSQENEARATLSA